MSEQAGVVVADASVIMAVLLNEPSKPQVIRATVNRELLSPPTLPWEIANALSAILKRRQLKPEAAEAAIAMFRQITVRLMPVALEKVLSLSASLDIYAYDACMIACALEAQAPLVTLDRGLKHAANRAGVVIVEVI